MNKLARTKRAPVDQWILEEDRKSCAAIALHYMAYNSVKIHKKLRVTPAMAAGVTDHVWEMEEIVELLEKQELKTLSAN